MISKEYLASQLTNLPYPVSSNLSKELLEQAKESQLVIVYGASDDNICFEGCFRDEVGAYEGGEAFIDTKGLVPDEDSEGEDLKEHMKRIDSAHRIEGVFDSNEFIWRFETDVPHATFIVKDSGEQWQCLVIDLKEL